MSRRTNPVRVTVVGSDPGSLGAIANALEIGAYEVTCLIDGSDVSDRIVHTRPDVICIAAAATAHRERVRSASSWAREQPELVPIPIVTRAAGGMWVRVAALGTHEPMDRAGEPMARSRRTFADAIVEDLANPGR